jgi:hypothetical protein
MRVGPVPRIMARTSKSVTTSPVQDIATSWARERPDLDPLDYLLPIYLIRNRKPSSQEDGFSV